MYITESNFKHMISRLECPIEIEQNQKLFYKDIPFLTMVEKRDLLLMKFIGENPEVLADLKMKNISGRKSRFLNIKSFNPAFHEDQTCENLNSSLLGIPIPSELIEQDREEEVRGWYEKNSYLLEEENFETLKARFHMKFGVTLSLESYENSGAIKFEDDSLENIESKINNLLEKAENFGNPMENKITKAFGKIHFIVKKSNFQAKYYDTEEVKRVVKQFNYEIRYPLINLITKYFIYKYNSKLSYGESVLSQLGFKSCSGCCKNKVSTFDLNYLTNNF